MLRAAVKVAILAVLIYKLVVTLDRLGVYQRNFKHWPGECRQVPGMQLGSEDFQVTKDGLAFISSGCTFQAASDGLNNFHKEKNIKGGLYLYDLNKPEVPAKRLPVVNSPKYDPATLQPHGMSVLEDKVKGEHLIYVISHRVDGLEAVEKFRYSPRDQNLVHLRTFTGDELHLTNDLAVIAEDKFFITNCLYFRNYYLAWIEQMLLPFGQGSIVFYDGTKFNFLETWLDPPNGISLSENNRYLYVNVPFSRRTNVYEVGSDSSIKLLQTVDLGTAADNFHLSESGDALYTGSHPLLYKVVQHLSNPALSTPSQVIRLPLKDGKIVAENITELFYDTGDLISGSSIAAVYRNKLLIGSIIRELVICDVNTPV